MDIKKSGVIYEYEDGTFEFVEGVEVPREGTPFEGREIKFSPEVMRDVREYHKRKRREAHGTTDAA